MSDKTAINQRFNEAISFLLTSDNTLNKTKIAKSLDIGSTKFSEILSKRMSVGLEALSAIVETYKISADWLLTGQGEMISVKTGEKIERTSVFKLKSDKTIKSQAIPLYNIEASAGIVTLFSDSSETKPVDYIQIPNLPKCDGAIYVTGDSMYPLLKSGDIIMYKQVHNIRENIFFGEMYLISFNVEGDEMVTVKYVQKSDRGDDFIKLVSQNKYHHDKDIQIANISAMALVKASIRINSMS